LSCRIPDSNIGQLFSSFYRAANVGKIPGTGLGLAIVKQCVELHGGTSSVDSTVGMGTTFSVMLPSAQEVEPVKQQSLIRLGLGMGFVG
jgi:signal transduction histidine kinase